MQRGDKICFEGGEKMGRLVEIYRPWETRQATPKEVRDAIEEIENGIRADLEAQTALHEKQEAINKLLRPSR